VGTLVRATEFEPPFVVEFHDAPLSLNSNSTCHAVFQEPSTIRNSSNFSKLSVSQLGSNVKPTKPPYASTASAQIGECSPNTWPT
jgi:hypothetical protein